MHQFRQVDSERFKGSGTLICSCGYEIAIDGWMDETNKYVLQIKHIIEDEKLGELV